MKALRFPPWPTHTYKGPPLSPSHASLPAQYAEYRRRRTRIDTRRFIIQALVRRVPNGRGNQTISDRSNALKVRTSVVGRAVFHLPPFRHLGEAPLGLLGLFPHFEPLALLLLGRAQLGGEVQGEGDVQRGISESENRKLKAV